MQDSQRLRACGIQPSAQRLAVAEYVLHTKDHPAAEEVFARVRQGFPALSRATVYNTLNLFVEKGLLRELVLREQSVVFDPNLEPHHHFIDSATGAIHDVPWAAVELGAVKGPPGFSVEECQVVIRGRRRRKTR